MGEESGRLRDYIRLKYCDPRSHVSNQIFDDHIARCNFCREFDSLAKIARSE